MEAPKTNESEPNMAARYKQAYDTLFAQLNSETQARVLAAKGSDNNLPSGVSQFFKNVISMAEDNKKL